MAKIRKPVDLADARGRLMTFKSARRDMMEAISVLGSTARYMEGARVVQAGGGQVAIVVTTAVADQLARAFETANHCIARTRDELDLWIREVEDAIDHAAGKPEPLVASNMAQALLHGRDFGFLEVGDSPARPPRP